MGEELEPTSYEQYFLELVNRARLNPEEEAALQNIDLNQDLEPDTISSEPKQPLAWNLNLLEAARDHSQWMLDTDTFDHTGVDGSSPSERAQEAGYPSSFVGENLAWLGQSNNELELSTSVIESLHEGLFLSSGHRQNLMREEFQESGVGILTGEFTNDGTDWNAAMATNKFGAKLDNDNSFITGVVYEDADEDNFYTPGEGVEDISVEATQQDNDFSVTTNTFNTGGYQLEVPEGNYTVTFSGEELIEPITESVSIDSSNVKVDIPITQVATEQPQPPQQAPELSLGQQEINFQTPLSQFRDQAEDSVLTRATGEQAPNLVRKELSIANTGNSDLTIQDIQTPDEQLGINLENPFEGDEILAPGESQTYTINFNPPEANIDLAAENAQITVVSEQQEATVDLSGQSTFQGDVNYNGAVRFSDLVTVSQNFGSSQDNDNFNPSVDVDYNGQIAFNDLVNIAQRFGSELA